MKKNNFYVKIFRVVLVCLFLISSSISVFAQENERVSFLTEANNTLGANMFANIAGNYQGNLLISPISIYSAFSLLYAGADGTTRAEMSAVLGTDSEQDDFYPLWSGYLKTMEENSMESEIVFTHSIWSDPRITLYDQYINNIDTLCPNRFQVDYSRPEDVRIQINNWVAENTRNKIKDLIPIRGIQPFPFGYLTLVNAITFKGSWQYGFKEEYTESTTFYGQNRETTVPMMHMEGFFPCDEFSNYKLLSLPYSNNEFSMIIILPDKEVPLSTFLENFNEEMLNTWLSPVYSDNVLVSLPRFDFKFGTIEIKKAVSECGLAETCGSFADFSRLCPDRFTINAVYHQTHINNNEEGTTAEAATAIAGCFPEGTLIQTPLGLVPIEQLELGSAVFSFNLTGSQWVETTVNSLIVKEIFSPVIEIVLNGEIIHSTGNHPFLCISGEDLESRPVPEDIGTECAVNSAGVWVAAEDLKIGDCLFTRSGNLARIDDLIQSEQSLLVYNLSVDENANYAVGNAGILVHNKGSQDSAPESLAFTVDHPFLFLIKENRYNGVLFIGCIEDLEE